ncbi:hypothetical protein WT60_18445 [Burkholderia sp. MSMB617WGS]|nr:hypothetical protein WT60_18445 [Burkholderia sp. MSMB617WGS]
MPDDGRRRRSRGLALGSTADSARRPSTHTTRIARSRPMPCPEASALLANAAFGRASPARRSSRAFVPRRKRCGARQAARRGLRPTMQPVCGQRAEPTRCARTRGRGGRLTHVNQRFVGMHTLKP